MADIRSNINVNIDTSNALAAIKQLQGQISAFHSSLRNSGSAANQAISQDLTKNLLNSINATKQFSATLSTVNNEAQAFTTALEKNKFSLGQYFKYSTSGTKSFGKLFKKEFDAIEKTAIERVKTTQTQIIKLGKTASGSFESIKVKPLTLDMQSLGTQVAITAQKQQIFNKLIQQGSTQLLNFGKNTQWAGRQLMVGLTIPLGILGSTAIQTFKDMEEQVIKFKRVYGELFTTQEETDQMVENLQKLAKEFTKYGVSVANTMELAAEAAAMGKMGTDLTSQVENATKLAVLGGVAQEEALKTTISLTNAFGATAEELAGQIDFLNAVENQTVTSIEDLTIAIPKAGPVIKQLGGDVQDLAFFLTAMKEGGINASEGANALKSGLARMINPTRQATDMLAGYGININAIVEGNAGNIKQTVLDFAGALDQLDPLSRARAIEQMFGKFQFARISALFQNVVAEGNQAQRVLQLTNATTEELAILSERELKRVEDSPLYKFQKAIEDIKVSLVPLGEQFLKLITPLVQFATKMLEQFNNLDSGVKDFITGIVGVLGLIAPVALMTFGLFANGIANLIKGFNFVRLLFVRVAQAGTGLNSQLNYMTQEHLEASTVAQQLAASHNSLTSSFLVEESALRRLIQAYTEAALAMQRYNAVAPVARTPGMKLASGIVSVPGPKGAGDVVPAMLSPGEAVIPSAMAKKYAPLIQGMISDNIPGFNEGLDPANRILEFVDPRRRSAQESSAIIGSAGGDGVALARQLGEAGVSAKNAMKIMSEAADNAKISLEKLDSYLSIVTKNIESAPKNQAGAVKNSAGLVADIRRESGFDPGNKGMPLAHIGGGTKMKASQVSGMISSGALKTYTSADRDALLGLGPEEEVSVKSGLGIKMRDQSINARLAGKGAGIGEFSADVAATGVEKWYDSIKIGGGNIDELSEQTKLLEAEFQRLVAAVPEGTQMFDSAAQAAAHTASTGQKAESLENLYGQTRSNVKGKAPELIGVLDTAAATPTEIRARGVQAPGSKRKALGEPMEELRNTAISEGIAEMETGGRDMVRGMVHGAQDEGEMNSPSRKMYEQGKDLVRGMVQGVKDGIAESMGTTPPASNLPKPPGPPPIPGFENKPTPPPIVNQNVEKGKNFGKKFVEKAEGAIAKGLSKTKTGRTLLDTMAQNQASQMNLANGGKGAIVVDADGKVLAEVKSLQDQRADLINKESQLNDEDRANLNKEEQLLDEQASAEATTRRGQRSAERQKEKQDKIDARRDAAQKRASRSGKALGVLGTMTMVAGMAQGMGGPVGEIASQAMQILPALTAIIPPLLALPWPLALLAGAALAIGYGLYKVNDNLKKAAESGRELAQSLSAGSKAMNAFADFAGTVNPTEAMAKRRTSQFGDIYVKPGKTEFGESFLASDPGKEFAKSVEDGIDTLGRNQTIAKVATQLGQAVASGIMTKEQVSNIVYNMGKQLGDTTFAIGVNAQLNELLGPNGENVLENGLQLQISLNQRSVEAITGPTGSLTKAFDLIETGDFSWIWNQAQKDLAKLEGQVASEIAGSVQQIALGLDSLDMSYQRQIDSLKEQGKLTEAIAKEQEYEIARAELIENNQAQMETLFGQIKQVEDEITNLNSKGMVVPNDLIAKKNSISAIIDQTEELAKNFFEGNDEAKKFIETLSNNLNLDSSTRIVFNAALASDTLNIDAAKKLIEGDLGNEDIELVASMMINYGAGTGQQIANVLDLWTGKAGAATKKANLVALLDSQPTEEFNRVLNILDMISAYEGAVGSNPAVIIDAYVNNPEKLDKLLSDLDKLNGLADNNKLEYDVLINTDILGAQGLEALKADAEYFKKLDPVQKFLYIQTLLTLEGTYSQADVDSYLKSQGVTPQGSRQGAKRRGTIPQYTASQRQSGIISMLQRDAQKITEAATTNINVDEGTGTDTTGSGTDLFADILNRLKQVRDASINAAGGIAELLKVAGKGKEIKLFSGIDQQLRFAGYGSEFINFVNGLDEASRETFVKIKNGVVSVTAAGKAMNKAFAEASLGDYQFGLVQGLADINKQITSVNRLMQNGSSLTDAYEMSKDAQLAYAIATAATDEEIQQLIIDFQKLKDAQEEWQNTSVEGLESLVNKQLGDIQEVFAAKEQKVQLQFEIDTAYLTNATDGLITKAQQDIEDLNYLVDDLNYGLDEISAKEDEVNKKYDERAEALNKIHEVNKDIVDLEQAQLDVAQALRSGDVAAAARAIQKQRADAAERKQKQALELLEKARQQELGLITDSNGKTRIQIEKEIKELNQQIAEIEEKRLEPNQKLLTNLERARDVALEAIGEEGYLGKTKAEWALVENAVRLAKTESEGFKQSIIDTLTNVEKLKALYNDPKSFVTETPPTPDLGKPTGSGYTDTSTGPNTDSNDNNDPGPTSSGPGPRPPYSPGAGNYWKVVSGKWKAVAIPPKPTNTPFGTYWSFDSTAGKWVSKKTASGTVSSAAPRKLFMSGGGLVPKYFAAGGFARGTDTVPSMLTPGEFVIKRHSVRNFGTDRLSAINNGTYSGESVYNYSVNVNVRSDANPDQIARAVMTQIKGIESQRMRSNKY